MPISGQQSQYSQTSPRRTGRLRYNSVRSGIRAGGPRSSGTSSLPLFHLLQSFDRTTGSLTAGDTFGPWLLTPTLQQVAHADLSTASWSQRGALVGLDQALHSCDGAFWDVISKEADIPGLCFQVAFKLIQLEPTSGITWSHEPGWCRLSSHWPGNRTLNIKYNMA